MGNESAMVVLPLLHHLTMVGCFDGGPEFFHKFSHLWSSSFPFLQVVSLQPSAVVSLGLLSRPYVPAPSPSVRKDIHFRLGHTGLKCGPSPFAFHKSVALPSMALCSLSMLAVLSTCEGASLGAETSPLLHLPTRGVGPPCFPFFLHFFHLTQWYRHFFLPF